MSDNLNLNYTFKRLSSEGSKVLAKNSAFDSPNCSSDEDDKNLQSVDILNDIKSNGCTLVKSKFLLEELVKIIPFYSSLYHNFFRY